MNSPTSPWISVSYSMLSDLDSTGYLGCQNGGISARQEVLERTAPSGRILQEHDNEPPFEPGDGDLEIWVNEICFETHKYLIKRFNKLKKRLHDLPSDTVLKLQRDENGADDFRHTLKVLYASIIEGPTQFESQTLISTLRVATIYDYPALRAYAIECLEQAKLTGVERIKIAREFELVTWEESAYMELCSRDQPITVEEARILGLETFVHVAEIRETEQRRRGKGANRSLQELQVESRVLKGAPARQSLDDKPAESNRIQAKADALRLNRNTLEQQSKVFGPMRLVTAEPLIGETFGGDKTNELNPKTNSIDDLLVTVAMPAFVPTTSTMSTAWPATDTVTTACTGGSVVAPAPVNTLFETATTTGQGTAFAKYVATLEREYTFGRRTSEKLLHNSISAMPAYCNFSFEELRAQDYAAGRKSSTWTRYAQTPAASASPPVSNPMVEAKITLLEPSANRVTSSSLIPKLATVGHETGHPTIQHQVRQMLAALR